MPDDPVGSWAMQKEAGTTTCATNSRSSSKARSVPAAAAPGPTAASAPALLSYSLLCGFPSALLEQQYVQYKHRLYLVLDYCCAVFALAYALSILGRMAWEGDAWSGLPALAMVLAKLLPTAVLLASKPAFLRNREVLVLVPELFKLFALWLPIILGLLPVPYAQLRALSRSKGDVVVMGLIRPLLQHLRFRWHLVVVLLEMAILPCILHIVVPSWVAVLLRIGLSCGMSLAVCAAAEVYARRRFVAVALAGQRNGQRGGSGGAEGTSKKVQ